MTSLCDMTLRELSEEILRIRMESLMLWDRLLSFTGRVASLTKEEKEERHQIQSQRRSLEAMLAHVTRLYDIGYTELVNRGKLAAAAATAPLTDTTEDKQAIEKRLELQDAAFHIYTFLCEYPDSSIFDEPAFKQLSNILHHYDERIPERE